MKIAELMIMVAPAIDSAEGIVRNTINSFTIAKTT